jgi:tungstate transport system ATP-binding protein
MGLSLALSNITKRHAEKIALDRCSVAFTSGLIYAVTGPNGCGKTTLLKICAMLDAATTGEVVYRENDRVLLPDLSLRRRISMVLSRVGVFNATVFSNVAYGLRLRALSQDVIVRRVQESLAAVGLESKFGQNARTLSSGETQRLGIARALAICPEMLFLDEPTSSIDEENSSAVETIIRALARKGTTTVVFSTHDREQAERIADEIILMRAGRIVETRKQAKREAGTGPL